MTKTRILRYPAVAIAIAAAAVLSPVASSAQLFTPTYMSPVSSNDLGIYVSDGPGEFALEGIWRRNMGGYDLGLRAGLVDLNDAAVTVGAELRTPLGLETAPLNVAVTGGLQAIVGDISAMGAQGGLSVGHTFIADGLRLTPYIHPRIAVINGFGPDDDSDLEVLADVGMDVDLNSGLSFRLALGLADEGADFGFGIAWR
ncbi:MAG TPA: hypothetical protein VFI91_08930 [Longimicrobiaceae bacterium]|nr:hypothetical protein [Longimicrobiaceae bacterium]